MKVQNPRPDPIITPAQDITDSLKPEASEPLKVKPDGRIFDGNTRIKVLEERGVDVDNLPRTIID